MEFQHVNYYHSVRFTPQDPKVLDDIFVALAFPSWIRFGYYRNIDMSAFTLFKLSETRKLVGLR